MKINYALLCIALAMNGCFLDFKNKDLSKYNFNEGTFFDGRSMVYVSTPSHYNIEGYKPYTFEVKIKADTTQLTYPTILSSRKEGGFFEASLFFLFDTAGVPSQGLGRINLCVYRAEENIFQFSDGLGYTSSPNLRDNQWHHIVMTRDSVNWEQYVDGKLVCEDKEDLPLDLSKSITIGGDRASRYNTYFHGYIKDLRVWTSYTANIQEFTSRTVTGSEQDLLGYWPLNPSLPNPLIDLSQNKSHGQWAQ